MPHLSGGGDELHRAIQPASTPTGGLDEDFGQLQATEDRVIEAIAYGDSSATNLGGEASFSSVATINQGAEAADAAKAQSIVTAYGELFVDDLGIEWSAGEDIHFHAVNNSGATERLTFTVYYREV